MARTVFLRLVTLLLVVVAVPRPGVAADQGYVLLRFEQYLDSLRQQAGIPGLSALLLQDGEVVWERGFGMQDVEASIRATPDTPYFIGDLTQVFSSTLLLRCADHGQLNLGLRVLQFMPEIDNGDVTLTHVFTHTSEDIPGTVFRYNPARIAPMATVVDRCAERPYRVALVEQIFRRLAMIDTVPGPDLTLPDAEAALLFTDDADRERYAAVLARLARPYRTEKGRTVASVYPVRGLDAVGGVVSTVRDLARFDQALADDILLSNNALAIAWSTPYTAEGKPFPHGFGWFVQTYNGERVVWQFGRYPGAASALYIKVPARRLTFILLANTDALASPLALQHGDLTTSLFGRLFLRVFL
jgi:CubicO group peptidase (beta-lactamase class C family)